MRARLVSGEWTVDMTAQQFQEMVERFFKKNPYPSCDELKNALVPSGIPNFAEGQEGRFGIGGIFKYVFVSSDGIDLMVKYHCADTRVLEKYPESNAAKGWTAQIICNYCSYFGWNPLKKKSALVPVSYRKARDGVAPRCDLVHIPLRREPDLATKD